MTYYPDLEKLGVKPDPIDDWGTPAPEGHPILGVSLVNSKQLQKAYAKSTQKNSAGEKEK